VTLAGRGEERGALLLEDHALLAEVHAGLGRALVGAVLQADDVLRRLQRLLREVARVGLGLARPHAVARVAGVRLHLHAVCADGGDDLGKVGALEQAVDGEAVHLGHAELLDLVAEDLYPLPLPGCLEGQVGRVLEGLGVEVELEVVRQEGVHQQGEEHAVLEDLVEVLHALVAVGGRLDGEGLARDGLDPVQALLGVLGVEAGVHLALDVPVGSGLGGA